MRLDDISRSLYYKVQAGFVPFFRNKFPGLFPDSDWFFQHSKTVLKVLFQDFSKNIYVGRSLHPVRLNKSLFVCTKTPSMETSWVLLGLACIFDLNKVYLPTYLVQSLNSTFFPHHIGAEPGRAKEEFRITCMRMLRTPLFFPPNRGKNHIWKYFPDLACGAIFWMIIYKQQFLHSDWLKTCQLIPDQWNFISATLNHIRFVFFFFFYHIIKDNERNLCQDLLTIENTDPGLKVHALHYANELLVRVRLSFQKLLQNRSTYRNNTKKMFGKRVRVQTTINHISIFMFLCFFLWQYQR